MVSSSDEQSVSTLSLFRGDVLLGTITSDVAKTDFPWFKGTFDPAPGFEGVRELFEKELSLLDADKMEEWEAVWEEIMVSGLSLQSVPGGQIFDELLIHIDGVETWWRC